MRREEIWEVTKGLDLSRYETAIRTRKGEAGRAAWPPRLLIAIWLYGYSQGITSARELARQLEYEPGLMWLSGMKVINHHTLSDFRIEHSEALTDLFAQMLVVLSDAGLVKMRLVAHDGTKIRAQAGVDSFRRKATLREKLEQARKLVEQDPQAVAGNQRQQAAQQRARRERIERVESALEQLEQIQAKINDAKQREKVRVSSTEAEARFMKHGDHAIAPSYNTQISTDADSGVIVGVQRSQSAEDSHGLKPAMEEVEHNLGRKPEQVVADGGFTNRESIQLMAEQEIDFYGTLPDPKERSEAAMKFAWNRSEVCAAFFHSAAGDAHGAVSGRQVHEVPTAPHQAGGFLRILPGRWSRLHELCVSKAMLSEERCSGPHRVVSGAGSGTDRAVPEQDGERRRAAHLQKTGAHGGVSVCLHQGADEAAEVSSIRTGQGSNGSLVGQPGPQRHDLDSCHASGKQRCACRARSGIADTREAQRSSKLTCN